MVLRINLVSWLDGVWHVTRGWKCQSHIFKEKPFDWVFQIMVNVIAFFGNFFQPNGFWILKHISSSEEGGQPKICGTYAENLFRVMFGTHPPFSSINHRFFLSIFRTHNSFSENANFFLWNLGTHPYFYRKFTFTQFPTLWLQELCLYSVVYSVIPVFYRVFEFLSYTKM